MPITPRPNGLPTFTPDVHHLNEITKNIHSVINKHIFKFWLQQESPIPPAPQLLTPPPIITNAPTFLFEPQNLTPAPTTTVINTPDTNTTPHMTTTPNTELSYTMDSNQPLHRN